MMPTMPQKTVNTMTGKTEAPMANDFDSEINGCQDSGTRIRLVRRVTTSPDSPPPLLPLHSLQSAADDDQGLHLEILNNKWRMQML